MTSIFKELQAFEGYKLYLTKKSWWDEDYELTDFENLYGRIYKNGILSTTTNYQSYASALIMDGSPYHDADIKTAEGKLIANTQTALFNATTEIKLPTGISYTFFTPTSTEYSVITDSNNYQLMDFERGLNAHISINLYTSPKALEEFEALLFLGLTNTIETLRHRDNI